MNISSGFMTLSLKKKKRDVKEDELTTGPLFSNSK